MITMPFFSTVEAVEALELFFEEIDRIIAPVYQVAAQLFTHPAVARTYTPSVR
jgi:hypothetical protein